MLRAGRGAVEVSVEEHKISFTAPSARQFVDNESENHPLAVAARPITEKAGRTDELRDRLVGLYEEANEDPSAFRVTSRYVVAVMERGKP
jgi:hypothetical protein